MGDDTIPAGGPECALPAGDLAERAAQWRVLSRGASTRVAMPGRVTSAYPRSADAAGGLRSLIQAEAECCPFLDFRLRERDDVIEVGLRYPPEFESTISAVLGGDEGRSTR